MGDVDRKMGSIVKPALILINRGLESELFTLDEGELFFTTDTFSLYCGSSAGNKLITGSSGGSNGLPTSLSALADANVISPDGGDFLLYDGSASKWINSPASAGIWATSLSMLNDILFASLTGDDLLRYNGTNWINTPTSAVFGSGSLNMLGDVTLGTISGNDFITYSSATSMWINSPASAGQWALKSGDTFSGVVNFSATAASPQVRLINNDVNSSTCIGFTVVSDYKWVAGMEPYGSFSLNDCDFAFRSFDEAGSKLLDVIHMKRTGEVGIGIEDPTAVLDVSGSTIIRQGLRVNTLGGSTLRYSSIFESNGNASMLIVDAVNNRVGVGISPASALDVNGEVVFRDPLSDRTFDWDWGFADLTISSRDGTGYETTFFNTGNFTHRINGLHSAFFITASGIVFNENSDNLSFRVEASNNASMLYISNSSSTVGIAGSAGSTLQVTGSLYNTGSANLSDIFYVNKGSGRVGINREAPDCVLEIVDPSVAIPTVRIENTGSGNATINFKTNNGVSGIDFFHQRSSMDFFIINREHAAIHMRTNNAQRLTLGASGGLMMLTGAGANPTGGDKGAGTINVAGDIYKNNSAYTNPDYVLENWATGKIKKSKNAPGAIGYRKRSLDEIEQHIKATYRLPNIGDEPMGMFERSDKLLEIVEELYIHVIEANKKIDSLENKLNNISQ